MSKLRETWNWGDKRALADRCGITVRYMSVVLRPDRNTVMNRGISVKLASKIVAEARKMGIGLDLSDLLFPEKSDSPLIMREVKSVVKKG